MIRINLLPVRQIKKRRKLRNQLLGFVASLLFLVVVLALMGFGLNQKIEKLKGDISSLNKKKISYSSTLAKIEKLKKNKTALEAKISAIKKLKKNAQMTVHLLDEVANATPSSRLWLESFQQSGQRISLTGVALDNATIAQYMRSLTASPYFADADLTNSSLKEIGGNKLKSFALGLQVQTPKEIAPATPQQ